MAKIEPIKPIPIPDGVDYPAYIGKINELIKGHNELIAAYNGHTHEFTSPMADQILDWEQSTTTAPIEEPEGDDGK